MSRKRSSKEKSMSEEPPLAEEPSRILVSTHAPVNKVSDFALYSDRYRYLNGVVALTDHAAPSRFSRAQLQWWQHLATTLPSPLLYPSHTVTVAFHPRQPLPPKQCDSVAIVILSVLDVHRAGCASSSPDGSNSSRCCPRPVAEAVAQLVGHSLTARGYRGAEAERKDETFTGHTLPVAPAEASSPSLTLTGHYHATHVNVCCGRLYYRLDVLDDVNGVVRSRLDLSRDLAAIVNDAAQCESTALYHRRIAPETAADIRGMYELLARVSAVDDASAADVYRRLEQEGEVNTYTLATLQSALFTVVLDGPLAAESRVADAQWLHSGLSLYFTPTVRGVFRLRAQGALVDAQTTRSLAEQLATRLSRWLTLPQFVEPLSAYSHAYQPDAELPKASAGLAATAASEKAEQLSRRVGKQAAALEWWLAEKHRVALRPYAALQSSPNWTPCPLLANDGTAVEGLLSLVLACEAVLFEAGDLRRPRVCLVSQDAVTKVPRAVSLYSPAIEAVIQYARAPRARTLPDTECRLREAALASLHDTLALADIEDGTEDVAQDGFTDVPEMDVCVTMELLPWTQDPANAPHQVEQCLSFLGAPARMFVNCTLQQTQVQKTPRLGDGRMMAVDVGSAVGEEDFAEAVRRFAESTVGASFEP